PTQLVIGDQGDQGPGSKVEVLESGASRCENSTRPSKNAPAYTTLTFLNGETRGGALSIVGRGGTRSGSYRQRAAWWPVVSYHSVPNHRVPARSSNMEVTVLEASPSAVVKIRNLEPS